VLHDALLIAGKDLRVEIRSRVLVNQVAPFALLVLVLFAFALDPDSGVLARATAGLFWIAVLFSGLLAIQRTVAVEAADGNRDGLRLAGLDPAGVFLGKMLSVGAQLIALEVLLGVGVAVLYNAGGPDSTRPASLALYLATALTATAGVAAAGSLYGVLAAGMRVRETLLPILLLPVVAPVLIAATQAFEAALDGNAGEGWPWVALLAVFAVIYTAFGIVAFGPLMEES
jgi:heme exporter protein B